MAWAIVLSAVLGLLLYFVGKAWKVNQHFKDKGVPHLKPVLFFGNLLDIVLKRRTLDEILQSIYDAFPDEPVVGYYHFLGPRLIIRDRSLIERVLISDFSYLADRGPDFDLSLNPVTVNLFSLTGSLWRAVRGKFSPMFSTSKLRVMFPQIEEVGDVFVETLGNDPGDRVDVRVEAKKFAMDVIGRCAFGIQTNTLKEGDNEFSRQATLAFKTSLLSFLRVMTSISFPNLSRILNINFIPQATTDYFANVIRSALKNRQETKEVRKDFVQLMMTLKDKGYLDVETRDPNDDYLELDKVENEKVELTDDMLIGQSFVFLLAGFETTSMAMMLACLDLSTNPGCQDKVREEIRRVVNLQGSLTFDALKDLRYLDRCLKETFRLHSPVGTIIRYCVRKYQIPGTSIVVEEDDRIMISVRGVHLDPKLYDQPKTFNPDRWDTDIKPAAASFLAFGEGPRICIGMRFALMEIKCFVAKLLSNYEIKLHPDVQLPLKLDPHAFLSTPLKNPLFKIRKIV